MKRLRFAPGVVVQVIDGEALILKLQEEVVFSLNDTGARVAQLIAGGRTVGDIVDVLRVEYARDRETVEADVKGLLGRLLERGLVVAQD